jgi:hypothetical protein
MNASKDSEEYQRILAADLSYPIIITGSRIIDGVHRVSRAFLEGRSNIQTYMIDKEILDLYRI